MALRKMNMKRSDQWIIKQLYLGEMMDIGLEYSIRKQAYRVMNGSKFFFVVHFAINNLFILLN